MLHKNVVVCEVSIFQQTVFFFQSTSFSDEESVPAKSVVPPLNLKGEN